MSNRTVKRTAYFVHYSGETPEENMISDTCSTMLEAQKLLNKSTKDAKIFSVTITLNINKPWQDDDKDVDINGDINTNLESCTPEDIARIINEN